MNRKRNGIYQMIPVALAAVILSWLYRLKLPFFLILLAVFTISVPVWIRCRKSQKQQCQRFSDVNLYMEQVLYSFRKSSKIYSALGDMEKLFPAGDMLDCIREASDFLRNTYEGDHIMENALQMIEKRYPARRLRYVHRFMLNTERIGGTGEASVRILLNDRSRWEQETISYQKRCQVQKRNITAAICLSCLLCLTTPVLCQSSLQNVNITGMVIYQIGTVILLAGCLLIYLLTEKYFTVDWLQEKREQEEEACLKKYYKVTAYDVSKARRKSFLWAAAAGSISLVCLFFHCYPAAAVFLLLGCLLLFQHRLDYALAKKAVTHEIRAVFLDWLMEVALLLQTENVANSIRKSTQNAPAVLRPQLREFLEKLEEAPESNLAYSEFLQEFSVPEITSAMGMLYSLSDGGGSEAETQMEEILARNAAWLGETEALKNQEKAGSMYLLFLLPALLASLKMIVDMTLILFAFFAGMK